MVILVETIQWPGNTFTTSIAVVFDVRIALLILE